MELESRKRTHTIPRCVRLSALVQLGVLYLTYYQTITANNGVDCGGGGNAHDKVKQWHILPTKTMTTTTTKKNQMFSGVTDT